MKKQKKTAGPGPGRPFLVPGQAFSAPLIRSDAEPERQRPGVVQLQHRGGTSRMYETPTATLFQIKGCYELN